MRHRSFLARVKRIRNVQAEPARTATTLLVIRPLSGEEASTSATPTWDGPAPPRLGQLVRVAYVLTKHSCTWRAGPA